MLPFLEEQFGNPSSIHRWGRAARAVLEDARARLGAVIGASPAEVVFTRGGTEADNLAVLGRSRAARGQGVVCSAIEHRAVLAAAQAAEAEGAKLSLLPVDGAGRVHGDALTDALEARPAVVSVMWANNETGTIQPIADLAEGCRAAGTIMHTDAVQALGKLRVRVDEVPVDLLTVSAHKLGGPKGVGALFVRRGTELVPLVYGGGQERGIRPGTEDVAGAVGLAIAAELAEAERSAEMDRLGALRNRLEAELYRAVPELVVHGGAADRLPTVLNVSIPGADPEVLLPALDAQGIAVSSGSACSSGAVRPSHVLEAMGVRAEVAGPSVRMSLGRTTTADEIDYVLQEFPTVVERLRALATL